MTPIPAPPLPSNIIARKGTAPASLSPSLVPELRPPSAAQRILITGASGLLGINLAIELAASHTVLAAASQHPLNLNTLPLRQRFSVYLADLLVPGALEALIEEAQPASIIHCAALANVDACERAPDLAWRLNSELPGRIARLSAQHAIQLLHVSTDAVFDGQRGDYTEQDEPNPLSVYARTKLTGERAVLEANPAAVVARVNLYGWAAVGGIRSLAEHFLYNLRAGRQVMGFTDVFFSPLLANQLAPIFMAMLEKRLSGLYHVVNSPDPQGPLSKYDFGRRLALRFRLDPDLIRPVLVSDAGLVAARSPRLILRSDRLASALGEPLPDFSSGLEQLYQLYQQGYPRLLRSVGGGPYPPL